MQPRLGKPLPVRGRDKPPEQGAAHALPAPAGPHCQAPDVAVPLHPRHSDRRPIGRTCKHMHAICVAPVPFKRLRDPLLVDEDRTTHGPQRLGAAVPRGLFEDESRHRVPFRA